MEPIKINEITVQKLDEVAEQLAEDRIVGLIRDNFIALGSEYRKKRYEFSVLEAKVKIRSMRLYHQHGFSKQEIADLLEVDVKEVRRWLK